MALPGLLFTESAVLDAAWRRVSKWYYGGEWAPQPEFAEWELHHEKLLRQLGNDLAKGDFLPNPMPLVPHSKKKRQLRHYCQPTVRDQVAFTLFGILLAPILENAMKSFSFGNRWFRRMAPPLEGEGPWSLRPWSLADTDLYQPYRRAHGLFRRVASWTIDAMLKTKSSTEGPIGVRVLQEDYPRGLIPPFARSEYWQLIKRNSATVFWARFDLRLAFPSVRLQHLHAAMNDLLEEALPTGRSADPLAQTVSEIQRMANLDDSLALYTKATRKLLLEKEIGHTLINYLIRLWGSIRYQPFDHSDELFFPRNPEEAANSRPRWLPLGDGAGHPGLPTGLALSPLLLNAYLHRIDRAMDRWMRGGERQQPAAFLRFSDDMILLADSPRHLAEGMEVLLAAIGPQDGSDEDLNLRLNLAKAQPEPIAELLQERANAADSPSKPIVRLLRAKKGALLKKLHPFAVTADAKDPFVTDLVERLSDLGAEKATDLLDEPARMRLTRLQELVVFKPDDAAVPRETQLVFAANQLVRTWLPEQGFATEHALLMDIRGAVVEALRGAPDKPKLWRSMWRAAIRRPTSTAGARVRELAQADREATKWLRRVVMDFRCGGTGDWVSGGEDGEEGDWPKLWPHFASFHRAALWRGLSDVARDIQHACVRQRDLGDAFSDESSWVFRALDERTLPRAISWLETTAHMCFRALYPKRAILLPEREATGLALAAMAFFPRSSIHFRRRTLRSGPYAFVKAVAEAAKGQGREWKNVSQILRRANSGRQTLLTPETMTWLSRADGKADAHVARRLASTWKQPSERLRLAQKFRWEEFLAVRLQAAAAREIAGHRFRLKRAKKAGTAAIREELSRYGRARRLWLELQGAGK